MPYYGKGTKRQVIDEYLNTSASMDELSELHGILGSNTVANWLRKYGNSGPRDMMAKKKSHPVNDHEN